MAAVVAEFFQVIGVDPAPPETMSELIVWLVMIWIGVKLVCGMFRLFGKLMEILLNWRRFS